MNHNRSRNSTKPLGGLEQRNLLPGTLSLFEGGLSAVYVLLVLNPSAVSCVVEDNW